MKMPIKKWNMEYLGSAVTSGCSLVWPQRQAGGAGDDAVGTLMKHTG